MTTSASLKNPGFSPPADEMVRLCRAGFSLLPLGGGTDGKSPLLGFKGRAALPLRRVLGPMYRKGSSCYGVLLDGLAVIDCDVFDDRLVAAMEVRFGSSPVHVRTPRGIHLYYRHADGELPNLRREGLLVDIKRGPSSYVVGPSSIRPDGGSYTPAKGLLGVSELPNLQCLGPARLELNPSSEAHTGGKIKQGSRNKVLMTAAIQMVESVDDPEELFINLQYLRDEECENPDSLQDSELRKIADWTWTRRLEGKLYHERSSEFRVHREALDVLKGKPNASDAIALFVTLQDIHGHVPGKAFALAFQPMRDTGHTDLSRRRFHAARKTLEDEGLLRVARQHRAGHFARTYQLGRARALRENNDNVFEKRAKGRV